MSSVQTITIIPVGCGLGKREGMVTTREERMKRKNSLSNINGGRIALDGNESFLKPQAVVANSYGGGGGFWNISTKKDSSPQSSQA
jgi:hypothetical protein